MSQSQQTIATSNDNKGKIKVDPERVLAPVAKEVYSGFTEHMGRCIYEGIVDYDNKTPGLTNEKGWRTDVFKALKDLDIPVVRYPGGNFVSTYHWLDAVGPKDKRPRRPELAWLGEESNQFGTDEFMEWCEAMGCEPYLCLNMGTGTLDEALAWVEYCNSDRNTYYANLRRQNGHEKPYNVKYWSLGNEVWGPWQVGQMTAEDYAKKAFQWAKALKLLDPSIKLIACGCTGFDSWDYTVTQGLITQVDLYSIHLYTANDEYYKNVTAPNGAENAIQICSQLIDLAKIEKNASHRDVTICFDEWNVWDAERAVGSEGAEEKYTLQDALAVATWLNVFIRQARVVGMANIAQAVNVISPILTSKTGICLQTIYYPLQLFSKYMRGDALNLHVKSPAFTGETGNWPDMDYKWIGRINKLAMLDSSAVCDGKFVSISIVNRDKDNDIETAIALEGSYKDTATVYTVYHDDINARNTFESSPVKPVESTVSVKEIIDGFKVKKHSWVLIRVPLA